MDTKTIRQKLYMSQQSFADALGLSKETVFLWEKGVMNPSLRNQKKIDELCKKNKIKIK